MGLPDYGTCRKREFGCGCAALRLCLACAPAESARAAKRAERGLFPDRSTAVGRAASGVCNDRLTGDPLRPGTGCARIGLRLRTFAALP